jgi:hypothetical protein
MMKYKISILSLAIASIMLVSMIGVAGVTAAQTVNVNPNGQVAAVCDRNGNSLWLFAQGANGNLYFKQENATSWTNLGGPIGSAPAAVWQPSTAHVNQVTVFFRGTDGALYSTTTPDILTATPTWSAVTVLPGATVLANTGPSAVYTATSGQTDVFYVDSASHQLMEDSSASTGLFPPSSGITPLGGYVTASPGAVNTSTSGIDVFVRGSQGSLYERMYASGGWGGYTKFNTGVLMAGTGPSATDYSGAVLLYVTGTDFHMYGAFSSYTDGVTWQTVYQATGSGSRSLTWWGNIGGYLTSSPSATGYSYTYDTYTTWAPVVAVRGSDNNIWTYTSTRWNAPPPIAAP